MRLGSVCVEGGCGVGNGMERQMCEGDRVWAEKLKSPAVWPAGLFYRSMKKLGTRNKLIVCHGEFYDIFDGIL